MQPADDVNATLPAHHRPSASASFFSPGRVWVLATSAFTQLVRMKVFYFVLVFAVIATALARVFVFADSPEQELKFIKDIGFAAQWIFADLFAIVATALLIPKDIEDRTLFTILSKPVSRLEYLIGKYLGVVMLMAVIIALMQMVFSTILILRENALLEEQMRIIEVSPPLGIDTPEQLERYKNEIRETIAASGHSPAIYAGTLSIFLKACVVAAYTMLLSTVASTTLFTILCGVGVYVIGFLQADAREYFQNQDMAEGIKRAIAFVVAIVFPDHSAFDILDGIGSGERVPASVMLKMLGLTVLYVAIYNVAAFFIFSEKEL